MKCFIVANDPPPTTVPYASGPGMRAHQLCHQLRAAGHDATIVMFADRYLKTSAGQSEMANRRDLLLVPEDKIHAFIRRVPPSTFFFTQANFVRELRWAAERHTVVFDCTARKDLEISFTNNPGSVEKYLKNERIYVENSDQIIVTSRKLQTYMKETYGRDSGLNPFAFECHSFQKFDAPTIFLGGRIHDWTDYSASFSAVAEHLAENPSHRGVVLMTDDLRRVPEIYTRSVSALLHLPNVDILGRLPLAQVSQLVGRSHVFIDIAEKNAERSFATSVRTAHAMSVGTPILHNSETGLDALFPDYPGLRSDTIDSALVAEGLSGSLEGRYRASVESAQNVMTQYLKADVLTC